MIQYDVNAEFAIFSEVYNETLQRVKQDLAERKQKVKWVYERDNLTAEQLKKTNAEEEHILLMVEYIRISEQLLQTMFEVLHRSRQDQIYWFEEWKKEGEKGLEFTQMMIQKYQKLKANEEKQRN